MSNPNVLFLVVDSLRYDAVFGESSADTPTIDRLANEGICFTNCFSQGISTAPSMTAMLTGRLPLDYGGHWMLDEDQPTFAETYQENGYTTGAVHSNPYVSARRNFDKGFDHFHEDIVSFEPDRGLEGAPDKLLRLVSRISRILSRTPYTPAGEVNEKMFEFVRSADSPWFLWAQYMDVHGPYLGGDDFSYRNKFRAEWLWRKAAVRSPDEISDVEHEVLRTNYEREIEYLDSALADLLDGLEKAGELDNTAIVFTADHGDEFFEHGRYGHGNLPYDELIHVPLIVLPPEQSEFSKYEEVNTIARCLDIHPTVLDMVDASIPDRHSDRLEGMSLVPSIQGKSPDHSPIVVTEKRVRGTDSFRIGFRTDEWKFIYDGKTEETSLFALDDDPSELTDVSNSFHEVHSEFRERLESRFEQIEETSGASMVQDVETDAAVNERLRALGYRE
jgi:arylsulfatase A-like enzyme